MKKILIILSLVAGGIGLVALFAYRVSAARKAQAEAKIAPPVAVPMVTTAVASKRDVAGRIELSGSVHAKSDVDVYAKVAGRAEKVLVEVGDVVKPGQLVAVIEHGSLTWQNEQAQAQTQVASTGVEQAKLAEAGAKRVFDDAKKLKVAGLTSQAEYDAAELAYLNAQAQVRAAQSQLAATRSGAGLAAETLDNSRIVSPIGGTVTKRMISVGTQITPAAPLFEIQDVGALKIEGTVPPEDFVRLSKGQSAVVTVDAWPGVSFPATVSTLSPSLDPTTRRAAVELVLDNSEGKLLPNMFCRASIGVGGIAGATVVPAAAVVSTPGGRVVYVLKGDKAMVTHPTFGPLDGDSIVVTAGLVPGDVVLVSGQNGLTDGATVKLATAPVSPPVSIGPAPAAAVPTASAPTAAVPAPAADGARQ